VAIEAGGVLELYVRPSVAVGTSHLKAMVIGVVVPGSFDNFSSGNFQLGF